MTFRDLILYIPDEEMSRAKTKFFLDFIKTRDVSMIEDTICDIPKLTPEQLCVAASVFTYLFEDVMKLQFSHKAPEWLRDPRVFLPHRYVISNRRGFLRYLNLTTVPRCFVERNLVVIPNGLLSYCNVAFYESYEYDLYYENLLTENSENLFTEDSEIILAPQRRNYGRVSTSATV